MTRSHPDAALDADFLAELERHNITVIPQAVYEWAGYRYSHVSDALAAAKRAAR